MKKGNKIKLSRSHKKKRKDKLDKIFVNCNKLEEDKAKRILGCRNDLSLKNWNWDTPLDLQNISKADVNRFETFIGLGRWQHEEEKKRKKFICIAKKGELIYLEPEIVKILYNSIKDK